MTCRWTTPQLPEEVIQCPGDLPHPRGIYWEDLDEKKIAAIPLLGKLREGL